MKKFMMRMFAERIAKKFGCILKVEDPNLFYCVEDVVTDGDTFAFELENASERSKYPCTEVRNATLVVAGDILYTRNLEGLEEKLTSLGLKAS